MKKFLSLLLVFAVAAAMVCAFAVNVSADGEEVTKPENATWFEDNDDNHVWWELTDNDTGKTLTVGGEGEMPDFIFSDETPWYDVAGNITAIKINSGVTSIGDNAFSGCTSLKEVKIPGNVERIGARAFSDCTGIATLTISEGVTSIGDNAFQGCASLKELTIPGSVESIGNSAFSECTGIAVLTIFEGVQSIGGSAFNGCSSLKEVTIPGTVTSIGDAAFGSCISLQKVTIPGSVTSIGDKAFAGCPNLVIHGTSGTAAAQSAKEHGIDFFDNGKCKHFARFTCDTCNTHLTKSELLRVWNTNGATGSTISGGSLTIICSVVAAIVFGLGGFLLGRKKKPALAGENKEE